MTPELDYAFLSEHVQLADGKLIVIGASYALVVVENLPRIHTVAVPERVRAPKDSNPADVTVFSSPADKSHSSIEGTFENAPKEPVRPYGDCVGFRFASSLQALLPEQGLNEVHVKIGDVVARRPAFTVEAMEPELG